MTTGTDAPAADIDRLLSEHPPELQTIEHALRRLDDVASPALRTLIRAELAIHPPRD